MNHHDHHCLIEDLAEAHLLLDEALEFLLALQADNELDEDHELIMLSEDIDRYLETFEQREEEDGFLG